MADVIAELNDKREIRLAKITKLQGEIDKLQDEANGLQVAINVLEEEEIPQQRVMVLTEPIRPQKHRKNKPKTMVERITDVLRAHGPVMHRKEILKVLEADNAPLSGKTPSERLSRVGFYLSTNKNVFEMAGQSGDGIWRLKQND
jgi:hypothetical protein